MILGHLWSDSISMNVSMANIFISLTISLSVSRGIRILTVPSSFHYCIFCFDWNYALKIDLYFKSIYSH